MCPWGSGRMGGRAGFGLGRGGGGMAMVGEVELGCHGSRRGRQGLCIGRSCALEERRGGREKNIHDCFKTSISCTTCCRSRAGNSQASRAWSPSTAQPVEGWGKQSWHSSPQCPPLWDRSSSQYVARPHLTEHDTSKCRLLGCDILRETSSLQALAEFEARSCHAVLAPYKER